MKRLLIQKYLVKSLQDTNENENTTTEDRTNDSLLNGIGKSSAIHVNTSSQDPTSSSLSKDLFDIYLKYTTESDRNTLLSFLKLGTHVEIVCLDKVILQCCVVLKAEYRNYLLRKCRYHISNNIVSYRDAEYIHILVLSIQNKWRCFKAKKYRTYLLRECK